jgi:hypothetical protein
MSDFIFMLTRNDVTVPDARAIYAEVKGWGITHVGCKDVGLPPEELRGLIEDIRKAGHYSYLEVVSESEASMLASARLAVEMRPDHLIGGTLIEPIREILGDTGIRFFPYVGEITGHPCVLRGSIREIVEDARRAESAHVEGINLLAYRYDNDVRALIRAVRGAASVPLICAGSINSVAKVREVTELGVNAFTIGTAVLDRRIVPGAPLVSQIETVLEASNG